MRPDPFYDPGGRPTFVTRPTPDSAQETPNQIILHNCDHVRSLAVNPACNTGNDDMPA
jgi:hypothetical protein